MKVKKEKKRYGLILFIVVIMIGTSVSFVFFGFSPATERVKYNGFSFASNGNIWISRINGVDAAFSFLPKETEDVYVLGDLYQILQGKYEIDATSDANSTYKESIALAQHQLALTLSAYNIFLRKGFTANSTFQVPIITCNDATANVPVIYFTFGNTTNINVNNSCVIAEASSNTDFIRVKDRLLYVLLGVVK